MLTADCHIICFRASPCGGTHIAHETPGFHVPGLHMLSGQLPGQGEMPWAEDHVIFHLLVMLKNNAAALLFFFHPTSPPFYIVYIEAATLYRQEFKIHCARNRRKLSRTVKHSH